MGPGGEQPPEQRTPLRPVGEAVHQEAHASGEARINQAARDLHLHYQNGVRGARRVTAGTRTQECPYPGLTAFGREQARWFFGRDQLTAELTARLDARLRTGGVQVVMAPSGAGKSSLLHAGLLAELADGALPGSNRWPTIVFTPTAHPPAALATQIAALTGADPASLTQELAARSQPAEAVLCQALLGHDGGEGSAGRLVVVVDQFEELFTLCTDDQQRRRFIELLSGLASPRSEAGADAHPLGLVVVGVRADSLTAWADHSLLRAALQDSPLVVGPMSDTELREAILYPAQDVGLDVGPGLVELLLRDLGNTATTVGESEVTGYEAGRLPLLAHALRATWQQRHGHTLTVKGYQNTGGIHRAVATSADRIFTGLEPAGRRVARTLFLRLVRIGDGTEDTRRRVARSDLLRGLDPSVGPVLDAFTRGRLLTQEKETVEITHEALLRAWPLLRQWVDNDRAGNLLRQELDEATAIWNRDHRDPAGLYRGNRLEAARAWAGSNAHEGDLSPAASAFLDASTQQERRAARLRRARLVLLFVLVFAVFGAAVVAFQQRATAQSERDTATFNQVIAQADRLRGTDISLAAQLDLTAYRMRPTPDLRTALITMGSVALATPMAGHTDAVNAVAFSPDGHTVVSGSTDRTVQLWDVADPAQAKPRGPLLTGHTDSVLSVAFSPDGHTLASGSADRTVRLWNVTDPARPMPVSSPLAGHTDSVDAVAFSPDGRTLASGSADRTVWLWNVTDPAHRTPLGPPLTGHTDTVRAVVFSPDGRTLASGSVDGTVRLWNVTDPARPMPVSSPLAGHTDSVDAVAFSPDGRTLASGGDRTVRLWNVTDPAHPTPLGPPVTGHTDYVHAVAFSPDGRALASCSSDRTVRLWNVTDLAHAVPLGPPLTGHTNWVNAVAFSPDGHSLASGSTDHTTRLWNIPSALMTGHTDIVSSVAFSPDGHTLATGSHDRTVRLWNVTDPAHPVSLGTLLAGHTGYVNAVAFSSDGRILAGGSADQTVRLWNMTDPAHPSRLGDPTPSGMTGYTGPVVAVAFSPDGHTLATGNSDRTVRLWNVSDPTHPTPLGQPLTGHTDPVRAVAFSPDGRTLASGSGDQTVRLWNASDPTHPTPLGQPLTGHTDWVNAVAFSPDGHTLVSGSSDQTVRLWNVTDPTHPTPLGQPLTGHTNSVTSVAFNPDGHTLASGSGDQTVRLWNVTDPTHPTPLGQPLTGHTDTVVAVAFSPDGHTLASSSHDRTVRLWRMNVNQTIRRICTATANTLTPAAWEQYVSPDLPYRPPCRGFP
ncbi:MAG: hypothetical protein JO364_13950 [Pseudonocardiales bacterium]|nr:hypothetical protein [Pseudonocardiales bacterium]MBV9031374.1 hypothetical protein [Pseudonocardiales bacterium]